MYSLCLSNNIPLYTDNKGISSLPTGVIACINVDVRGYCKLISIFCMLELTVEGKKTQGARVVNSGRGIIKKVYCMERSVIKKSNLRGKLASVGWSGDRK